ncbi:MAG: polysaccharide pyruvyl transferase family protein [Planctomycetota bacterium]
MTETSNHFCLFGAAPGTQNLGVDALSRGLLGGLARRVPDATFTVFDYRRGAREGGFALPDRELSYELLGANHSRRLWRGDTLATMRLAARLGGLGNRAVAALKRARCVLDLSGGDSFTDLYGPHRFETVSMPKRLALEVGAPLVLPPQTYGPFQDASMRAQAARLCRGATSAWARDARSFRVLQELLGDDFDPGRHRLGVDVAFGMEPRRRPGGLDPTLDRWVLERDEESGPVVVGLNVSGLVWHSDERAQSYGFVLDYRSLVRALVDWLLDATDARIALVPHVVAPPGHYESDPGANDALVAELVAARGDAVRERVVALAPPFEPEEIKAEIARMDWFDGTRMHATIAALSTGVPTSAIAYSPKFRGVFERADQADGLADPTRMDERTALRTLRASFTEREAGRARLAAALPSIKETVTAQIDSILGA